MMNKLIQILNVCIAFFVILYAAHIYTITADISLVTVAWNYIRIKLEEYREEHSHRYMKG